MLGIDGEYSSSHPKAKFWRFSVKNRKILAEKHFIEKPILLNFVNLCTAFCPRLEVFQRSIRYEKFKFFNLLLVSNSMLSITLSFWMYLVVSCCNYHSQIKHASHFLYQFSGNIYICSSHQEVYHVAALIARLCEESLSLVIATVIP